MRVAVVDIGTNSTRLLVTDVADGRVGPPLARESRVTRLGQGVDATGRLADEAQERVFAVLEDYRAAIDALGASRTVAVLTSAVRDAANGAAFTEAVRERFRLDARTIPGAEEAALTFLGATSERRDGHGGEIAVVDIGGGSTEIVVGNDSDVSFFVSLQVGVVRQTERRLRSDPPDPEAVQALTSEVTATIDQHVPAHVRERVHALVAVAGTATSAAAIELALEPYDPERVHGQVLTLAQLEAQLERLAALREDERRQVAGLHPDRAPTIVAGVAMLIACAQAFGQDRVEVSEHDILRGAALRAAAEG